MPIPLGQGCGEPCERKGVGLNVLSTTGVAIGWLLWVISADGIFKVTRSWEVSPQGWLNGFVGGMSH